MSWRSFLADLAVLLVAAFLAWLLWIMLTVPVDRMFQQLHGAP